MLLNYYVNNITIEFYEGFIMKAVMNGTGKAEVLDKRSEKIISGPITDLVTIFIPDAQVATPLNTKEWPMNDLNCTAIGTGEAIFSAT